MAKTELERKIEFESISKPGIKVEVGDFEYFKQLNKVLIRELGDKFALMFEKGHDPVDDDDLIALENKLNEILQIVSDEKSKRGLK